MNYRHAFHAGNFADVHKHLVLLLLLESLHKKPAPFLVLDTHAGRGLYDLTSDEARRGNEWEAGFGRIQRASTPSAVLQRYRELVYSTPKQYLGSPLLAAAMLRDSDRAVFVERHPEEANALRKALGSRRRVSVLEDDGYAVLKGQLPPKENRGLVLIDPPFEKDTEFADAAKALQFAHQRWPNGQYCLWYPIKAGSAEHRLHKTLIGSGIKKILLTSLLIRPADSPLGLNGSGLLIVNPPWQLDEQLRVLMTELHQLLSIDGAGGVRVEWLVAE